MLHIRREASIVFLPLAGIAKPLESVKSNCTSRFFCAVCFGQYYTIVNELTSQINTSKNMKNKFFLATALLLITFASWASDVSVDGIWYTFNRINITATVSYRGKSYLTYSNEYTGSVVIPSTITYNDTVWRVTSIGNSAFRSCTGVTSVTIPSGVTSIGNSAFKGCTSLLSVSIPNSVTSIQGSVFYGCTSLLYVSLPNQLTSVTDSMFCNCSGLTSITIPNSATKIGYRAFYGCTSLKSIDIPNNVTTLGSYAFYGCTSLLSVSIPNSVTSIESYAFYGCTSLLYANIPKSVTQIPDYLFKNCRSLTSILIPNTIISIGIRAFEGCSKLSSITIPSSVTSVGTSVFLGCSGLESVYISHNPAMVFERVSNTTYDSHGYNLFRDCTSLRTIYNYNTTPQKINTNSTNGTFNNVDQSLCTLYVPSTAVETYRAASGWKDFTNIEAVPDLTITVSAEHATTFGTGSYPMTQNAVIAVTADDGWRFVRWSDGNTDNPRIVTVTGNATYTAVMEKTAFTIRVAQDCNVTVE